VAPVEAVRPRMIGIGGNWHWQEASAIVAVV